MLLPESNQDVVEEENLSEYGLQLREKQKLKDLMDFWKSNSESMLKWHKKVEKILMKC